MSDTLPALPTEPQTLPDGTILTALQAAAALLSATTDMTHEQIAEHSGYANRATVGLFLASEKGKLAVEAAVREYLLSGARVGLQTMVKLAKSAKSENVRQLAAADLMNRAGLQLEGGPSNTGNREVSININLTGVEQGVTLDAKPVEPDE